MRVYNINKAIGLASSGVEYAQKYRRGIFADIAWVDDYYVFTDYMGTNITVFSDRLGFPRSQVMWIYNVLSGREARPSTVTIDEFRQMLGQSHSVPQPGPDRTFDVALAGSDLRYRIRTLDGKIVDRVETLAGDQVVRVEHYDQTLNNVEHLYDNRVVRRVFYAPDGRVAAEQSYRDDEIVRTVITAASPLYAPPTNSRRGRSTSFRGDVVLDGRSQFFQFVFGRLLSRPDDVVIVDRALDVIDGLYPVIGEHRLYSVVHAEHFDLKQVEDGVLLWNNHYEHVFTRPDLVDALVVSTDRQKQTLERQLSAGEPRAPFTVVRIPVGVVATSAAPEYDRLALVTASRLASEKHLDILIRALSVARRAVPGLRLDIFGEGSREGLLEVIRETETQDCVRLMGHHDLNGLFGSYGLYVTASTSEGFGLSLLEAMAEGLPLVGFDVDYGNRELIEPDVNGALVPVPVGALISSVNLFAEAIVAVVTSGSLDAMREQSLQKAQGFTAANVRTLWERLLSEEDEC